LAKDERAVQVGFDVVVIGDGIIGQTCARALIRRDGTARVAVIGPRKAAGGASAAAGAMLGCFGEVTKYTLANEAGRMKFELSLAAHELWPSFVAALHEESGATAVRSVAGTHVILNGRSGSLDSENFVAMLAALGEYGGRSEPDVVVPGLHPSPDGRPLRSVYLPDEGAVDAGGLLDLLAESNRRAGVHFIDGEVRRVDSATDAVTGVVLSTGQVVSAPHVVVAAGAFSGPVLDTALPPFAVQPLLAGSGVALITERVLGSGFDAVVRTVNRAGSCGLHVVPLDDRVEYVGATNVIFGEPEVRPHVGIVHFLAECAIDQLDTNITYSRILETRLGNRPVPLDTFPLLGRTALDGLIVVTGTYRDGFHAAPLLAEMVVTEVMGGGGPVFPSVFDPMRFPIEVRTRQESIDDFAFEAVSGAFENGTRLSRFMDQDDLMELFRARAVAFYERSEIDSALAPDVLNYLIHTRKDPAEVDQIARYWKHAGA